MTLVLNDDDVAHVLKMEDCINVLEAAFTDMGKGLVGNAPRRDTFLTTSRSDGYYSFKTIEGGLANLGVMAQRINSDLITYPVIDGLSRRVKVPAASGSRYVGLVFLYSVETLELLAIITDGHLQRMRVAGTTGVGVKHLARGDAQRAALIGTGWQAEAAAWALATARPLREIRVFSPNPEHRRDFASRVASSLNIDVSPVQDAQKAVESSDIVATATNSHGPVVKGDWLEPGMHVTSIIATEYDDSAWEKSDLVIFSSPSSGYSAHNLENLKTSLPTNEDQRQTEERRNQLFQHKIHLLSDLLVKKAPARSADSEITMMHKGWGLGIEFAAVGKLIYDRAREANIGKKIPGEWFTQTSHP